MDMEFFGKAMDAVGLRVVVLDEESSKIKRLHPTLKKCRCGLIGSKHEVIKHIEGALRVRSSSNAAKNVKEFWELHGEVPLNEGDV